MMAGLSREAKTLPEKVLVAGQDRQWPVLSGLARLPVSSPIKPRGPPRSQLSCSHAGTS